MTARTDYKRIATEEAFATPELFDQYRRLLREGSHGDPGFASLYEFYLHNPNPAIQEVHARLTDLGHRRIQDMDQAGISKQIISLTSPGVQIFDTHIAVGIAESTNDRLADAVRRHPDRFAGLAAIAPQDPAAAAKELERGVNTLGLKGAIVNSHTRGEYLDEAKFWPIFEAAESLGVPIYLHPNTPSPAMIEPFLDRGLEGAIFGFAVETGLHILRMIVSGVFDHFPRLQMVVGHLGEGLPYWFFRLDFMHNRIVGSNRYPAVRRLTKKISDYVRENFFVTTSGMSWAPPILYARSVLGIDRIMFAMDYPYQFVAEEARVIDNLPISEADKSKLYHTNAERIFRL